MLARGHLPYFHVYGRIMFAPYNGIPRCSGRCLHRPAPQAGARPSGPMTSIGPYSKDVEEFRPRRGQSGQREKSVKKNAALLHFLGFFSLTLLFGVLRGEQPLRRGPLPRNSGTFFATFFGHKKGRPNGRMLLYRGVRRKVAEHRKELLSGFLLAFGQQRKQPTRHRCPHGRAILGNGA